MTARTTHDASDWLTAGEVAAFLSLSVRTLNRMEHRGELLPRRLPSGRRRYRRADVEALLTKRRAS